jgi:hypothetical protein
MVGSAAPAPRRSCSSPGLCSTDVTPAVRVPEQLPVPRPPCNALPPVRTTDATKKGVSVKYSRAEKVG